MATVKEIATVRRMTALDADDPIYTDTLLGGMFDDLALEATVAQVWKEKAAATAGLVDTTESGSSRALGQLRKAALEMAAASVPEVSSNKRSYTVAIERV